MAQVYVTRTDDGRTLVEWTWFEADDAHVECTDCGTRFWYQPVDFLRYDRWRDRWVTKAEERDVALPNHGICKPCQDAANEAYDDVRYGGPNHWQVEQRIMEDERWVWES